MKILNETEAQGSSHIKYFHLLCIPSPESTESLLNHKTRYPGSLLIVPKRMVQFCVHSFWNSNVCLSHEPQDIFFQTQKPKHILFPPCIVIFSLMDSFSTFDSYKNMNLFFWGNGQSQLFKWRNYHNRKILKNVIYLLKYCPTHLKNILKIYLLKWSSLHVTFFCCGWSITMYRILTYP
jgi:hypothetical protein